MKVRLNNKIKHFGIILLSIVLLFFLSYGNFYTYQINQINNLSERNDFIEESVSPKRLFNIAYSLIKQDYYNQNLNGQNWSRWKNRYANKIKTKEDAYIAINSMIASLDDPYSKFLSDEEYKEQNSVINSKLYGIGINIASSSGKIYIVNVVENAPAFQADIHSGDIILKVNDNDINGQSIYEVAKLIRGDVNQNLTLELIRGNDRLIKTVKRQEIKIKTIEEKKITDDIGYIRISSFVGLNTPQDFIIALNHLKETKALIIDVRSNPGGLFQNAILIANLFMKKGEIVHVHARKEQKNTYSAKDEGCIYNNPLVVLIDGNSASASEILASALRDNNRATLIGTKTYGKGLVQKVFPLPNKTGMNLTIAKYLTPKNTDINNGGINPDYIVNFTHDDFINNHDPQLTYAKNYLEKKIKKL